MWVISKMARYDIKANRNTAKGKQKMVLIKPLTYSVVEDEAKKNDVDIV